MSLSDSFSAGYAGLIDGDYDCVDRIILNAYFRFAQTPGGFRTWWRELCGTDDNLDDAHLVRMAGRFSRRVRAWCKAQHLPVIDCRKGDRKHKSAEDLLPEITPPAGPPRYGVFCVLVGRAPAPIWTVHRFGKGGLDLRRKTAYVNHYYFHILDPEWGHVCIKICGHPPFNAQVMLNGHEFVERAAVAQRIPFVKEGNCFTELSDARGLSQLAETLRSPSAAGRLQQVCERWIYSACLCFGLDLSEQARSRFGYQYSVFQLEYSRNLLFKDGRKMERVVQALIDRNRSLLDLRTVRSIFGLRRRPGPHKRGRFEVTVESPAYDLTVFKIHFSLLTVKVYTKGERVLRIETIVHNTKVWNCRRSLPEFGQIVERLRQILYRFLEVVHCVDECWISDETLERLPQPTIRGQRRVAGLDLNRPRIRAVLIASLHLATQPGGFRASQLAEQVTRITGQEYTSSQASYDLRKLRAKDLVERIAGTRRYQIPDQAIRTLAALVVLRERVLRPILAGARAANTKHKPRRRDPIENQYARIQWELRQLFKQLKFAA